MQAVVSWFACIGGNLTPIGSLGEQYADMSDVLAT
jgi:hypothetical protein